MPNETLYRRRPAGWEKRTWPAAITTSPLGLAVLGEGARREARAFEVEVHVEGARRVELEVEDEEPLFELA